MSKDILPSLDESQDVSLSSFHRRQPGTDASEHGQSSFGGGPSQTAESDCGIDRQPGVDELRSGGEPRQGANYQPGFDDSDPLMIPDPCGNGAGNQDADASFDLMKRHIDSKCGVSKWHKLGGKLKRTAPSVNYVKLQ